MAGRALPVQFVALEGIRLRSISFGPVRGEEPEWDEAAVVRPLHGLAALGRLVNGEEGGQEATHSMEFIGGHTVAAHCNEADSGQRRNETMGIV